MTRGPDIVLMNDISGFASEWGKGSAHLRSCHGARLCEPALPQQSSEERERERERNRCDAFSDAGQGQIPRALTSVRSEYGFCSARLCDFTYSNLQTTAIYLSTTSRLQAQSRAASQKSQLARDTVDELDGS
jgi:hypothetical protein